MRFIVRNVVLLSACAAITGCSAGAEKPKATATSETAAVPEGTPPAATPPATAGTPPAPPAPGPQPGDDETEIIEATPIGLLGPELFAKVKARFAAAIAGAGESSAEDSITTAATPPDVTADQLQYAITNIDVPSVAARAVQKELDGISATFAALFGEGGYFGAETFDLKHKKKLPATLQCALPASSGASFAIVAKRADNALYPFEIGVYSNKGDRFLWVEFGGDRTHVVFAKDQDRVDATIAQTGKEATIAFGVEPAGATAPARTLIKQTTDTADRTALQGAFVWRVRPPAPEADILIPRYYSVQTGDIQLFRAVTKATDAQLLTAQSLAFVPAGSTPASDPFATYALDGMMAAFIATAVQTPEANPDCAKTGATLRGGFAAGQAPAAVAALPDDLCAANSVATQPMVVDAIAAICKTGIDVTLPVQLVGKGAVDLSLCKKNAERIILANPQLIAFDTVNATRDLVATAPADLLDALATLPALDFQPVTDAWPTVPHVDPAAGLAACR